MENILYDSKFGKVTFTRNSSNDCVIMTPLSNTIIFYPLHNPFISMALVILILLRVIGNIQAKKARHHIIKCLTKSPMRNM